MRPTIEQALETLAQAHRDVEAQATMISDIKKQLSEADKSMDLFKRALLNAEQQLRDAIRARVGGPGDLF